MSDPPLISIIMPVYNCGKYLDQSIESILFQTYEHWELLISDDASTDNTYEVLSKYLNGDNRIRIFRNVVNLKQLKTRNYLFGLANGELITFQDGDDFVDKFRLEKMVREFQRNPTLGLLSSQVGIVNAKGDLLRVSKRPTDYESTLKGIRNDNVIGGSMVMMKRTALDSVGGKFRPYFDGLSYQDYDLSILIAEKFESYSLPDVLYYYRQHGQSSSKIVHVDRAVAKKVVMHLARQRETRGSDDLIDGHENKIDEYFESARKPYREDPSLIFREYAASFMYNHLHLKAIQTAWKAVRTRPFSLVNWSTLQYCIRRTVVMKLLKCQEHG